MATLDKPKSYQLQFEEKATPVMVYTMQGMVWGEVVTKELVRVSTWLRTPTAPSYIALYDCQLLYADAPNVVTVPYTQLNIPVHQIVAFHMMPPHQDPLDYDVNEPNRKLEPISALIGPFRFNGRLRMSVAAQLHHFLELQTEKYTSLYEVEVTQPLRPQMKGLRVPYTLIRRELALVAPRALPSPPAETA